MMVTVTEKEIKLCSRMEELNFSKTNYDSVVTQKGLLAKTKKTSDGDYQFSMEDWSFSDIKSFETEGFKNRVVYYCGENPLGKNAKPLADFGSADFFDAGYAVCALLTQAAKEERKVPAVGGGGILVDMNKDEISILLLPEDLFKFSVSGMSEKEYSSLHAHWLNASIYDLPSVCFSRSVIAYKMLTDTFPYPTENQLERNADFLDSKFIPVQLYFRKLDNELANAINKGLKLNSNSVNIPGHKKRGKANEDLTPTADFPLQSLFACRKILNKERLSKEEFTAKTESFVKKQENMVFMKRKIRRNKTLIICVLIGVALAAWAVKSTVEANLDNYTSKGLTATQTIQAYYYGVNVKNTTLLDDFSHGGNTKQKSEAVSNIYVVGKMRQNYNLDKGFLSPGRWVFEAVSEDSFAKTGLYGVTNLYIDDKLYGVNPEIALKKSNPQIITEEDGRVLKDGDTVTKKIRYYHLYTEGEVYQITVSEYSGTVTLTYTKDKWIITNFDTTSVEIPVDTQAYKNDYFAALKTCNYNVYDAINMIRDKYIWLPQTEAVEKGLEEIQKEKESIEFVSQ